MTNWKALAEALDPPVGEEIVPAMEKLEAAFRPHQVEIPFDALTWTGPEDPE